MVCECVTIKLRPTLTKSGCLAKNLDRFCFGRNCLIRFKYLKNNILSNVVLLFQTNQTIRKLAKSHTILVYLLRKFYKTIGTIQQPINEL